MKQAVTILFIAVCLSCSKESEPIISKIQFDPDQALSFMEDEASLEVKLLIDPPPQSDLFLSYLTQLRSGWALSVANPIKIPKNEKEVILHFNNTFNELDYYTFGKDDEISIEFTGVSGTAEFNSEEALIILDAIDVDKRKSCVLSGSVQIISDGPCRVKYLYFDQFNQLIEMKEFNSCQPADNSTTKFVYTSNMIQMIYNDQCLGSFLLDQSAQIISQLNCEGTTVANYFYDNNLLDSVVQNNQNGIPIGARAYRKYINNNPTEIRHYSFPNPNLALKTGYEIISYDAGMNPLGTMKYSGILLGRVGVNNPSSIEKYDFVFGKHEFAQITIKYQQNLLTTFSIFYDGLGLREDYFYHCN